MQKITPFLWFDNNAEEAMAFYTSIFKNSRIVRLTPYSEVGPGPKGEVMFGTFLLDGQEFIALNGGPDFKFTPALSLLINCKTQEEIDHFWEKLSEGGEKSQCGWLTDKFGVSWQVCPTILLEYQNDPDPAKAARVMKAMLKMTKLIIKDLKAAYDQE